MRYTIKDKISFLKNDVLEVLESLLKLVISPFCLIYAVLLIMIHPILYIWTYFQCMFLIDFYILRKYCDIEYDTLLRYNINLNSPSRRVNTFKNRIYRWCTFKIFERNNYKFDPERKASYWD